ncbi:MAG: TolC family protein, partial [Deltaproteobacteria bacterium]|nr:TolC family protein [Deltaproteobacteria bacterium]
LEETQRNIEAKLLELLSLPPDVRLGTPKRIETTREMPVLDTLYGLALERRQELRRKRAVIGKMERMVEMIETMVIPPFTLNLSLYEDEAINKVGFTATKETFPVKTKAYTGAGLPKMPGYGSNDAYLRKTKRKLQALREDLKENEAVTVTMVRKAWFDLDLARREELLYRDRIVQQTQAALDVSLRGYESGNVTFADMVSSYKIWLQARLNVYKKRSDLESAWAELEKTVGVTLR